jgi:hypothetical protein
LPRKYKASTFYGIQTPQYASSEIEGLLTAPSP